MDTQSVNLPRDGRPYLSLAAGILVGAVLAYIGVSAILEAFTGIDVPLANWPF
jgi:hypothetical protein